MTPSLQLGGLEELMQENPWEQCRALSVYKYILLLFLKIIVIFIMSPSTSLSLNWGQDLLACFELTKVLLWSSFK